MECPISREIMKDPVTCADGHSYERAEIEKWFTTHSTSPCTGLELQDKRLIPNHSLKKAISDFLASKQEEEALALEEKNFGFRFTAPFRAVKQAASSFKAYRELGEHFDAEYAEFQSRRTKAMAT